MTRDEKLLPALVLKHKPSTASITARLASRVNVIVSSEMVSLHQIVCESKCASR